MDTSRHRSSEREIQPVAIIAVNPVARTATGATRIRSAVTINCAYATGDTVTVPAVGEQWYVERFDMEWRLYGRIPFNDPTLNIEPEEGQVSVGSASGPLELNGTEVRSNAPVFRLNGAYYRDHEGALERSEDKITWEAITSTGLIALIAKSLTDFQGTDQTAALLSLTSLGDVLQTVIDNFTAFWTEICQNVFVNGLKQIGFGDTDLQKIIDGLQNFLNYLFGALFCDFSGELTPQIVLTRLTELLAPILTNPFVLGLQAIAEALNVAVGNLINDAVAGLTGLIELVWNIVTCRWDQLDLTGLQAIIDTLSTTFGPATIVDFLKKIFLDPIFSDLSAGTLTPIIGTFLNGLKQIAELITGQEFDSLLEGLVQGVQDFVQLIYDTVTEILGGNPLTRLPDIAAIIALITEGASAFSPANIVRSVTDFFTLLGSPTFIIDGVDTEIPNPVGIFFTALGDFWRAIISLIPGATDGGLFRNSINAIAEMFSILQNLIFVNPFDSESLDNFNTAVAKVEAAFASTLASAGVPTQILNVLKTILNSLINNPLVKIAQEIFTYLGTGLTGTNLLGQIVDGSEQVFNLLMKIITDVLIPLGDTAWNTLLPFIPADVWDNIRATELPDFGLDFLGGLGPLLKVIFEALENLLGLDTDNISNFFQNILTFFSGTLSSFFTLLFDDQQAAINYFLTDVIKIATMSVDDVLEFIIGGSSAVAANLLALFGIDFDAEDFNATTAINTFLTTVFGGVFGSTAAEVTRFFTRLKNLFGLADFTNVATFDFAAAATGFINSVLVNAPAAAVSVLQGVLDTVTSLAYKVADAVIQAIRGVPFVGTGIADFLKTLLNNFTDFTRGNVNSGTNLLADAGAEKQNFWRNSQTLASYQTGVTWSTAPKKSGGGSLMVSAGNFLWFNVNDLGERSPIRTQPDEYIHSECYVYSYFNATVYLYARAENSLTGATYDYYLGPGTVTASNPAGFTKVQADVLVPAGWDRISFGVYSVNYPVYVDDMLVREITAAQVVKSNLTTLNQALYQADTTPAGTTPKINVAVIPTGIPATSVTGAGGVSTIGAQFTDLSGTVGSAAAGTGLAGAVSGTNGLVTTVGSSTAGTGLAGAVSGTNGLIKKLYGPAATTPGNTVPQGTITDLTGAFGGVKDALARNNRGTTPTTTLDYTSFFDTTTATTGFIQTAKTAADTANTGNTNTWNGIKGIIDDAVVTNPYTAGTELANFWTAFKGQQSALVAARAEIVSLSAKVTAVAGKKTAQDDFERSGALTTPVGGVTLWAPTATGSGGYALGSSGAATWQGATNNLDCTYIARFLGADGGVYGWGTAATAAQRITATLVQASETGSLGQASAIDLYACMTVDRLNYVRARFESNGNLSVGYSQAGTFTQIGATIATTAPTGGATIMLETGNPAYGPGYIIAYINGTARAAQNDASYASRTWYSTGRGWGFGGVAKGLILGGQARPGGLYQFNAQDI